MKRKLYKNVKKLRPVYTNPKTFSFLCEALMWIVEGRRKVTLLFNFGSISQQNINMKALIADFFVDNVTMNYITILVSERSVYS